ncbi:uncharacterized protein TRAVEDRAFT_135249 [Trametes versicolor FP-101664 SS1]|uniref:uncharacterized protein n=1 Tax=Trametes versicolor (strain FP-101664) TaxID=717944 RepID=UPI0004622C35|nr:uncharacterized protein TRAVEDRAFT_135249 [Trametes versicolor FP-101664 SS1]EIW52958.1 hypothetical protein TRAVEDRAFT_135249 [Trametes versicolor FP-101664 SS1]
MATLLAARTIELDQPMRQVTDSKTVMEALTKRRVRFEDEGFIASKNGPLTMAAIAAIRERKAHTAFKWVKGHSGHVGNEAADRLAAAGAGKEAEDDLSRELSVVPCLRLTGAKLSAMTQKLAYKAIRKRKAAALKPRRATQLNLKRIQDELLAATGRAPKTDSIWTSLRKTEVSRECAQFMWKTIHDAFMVGHHWQRPNMGDELRERAICKLCDETETMDHILFRCDSTEARVIWKNLCDLWEGTGQKWHEQSWGTVLGAACLIFESEHGTRLPYTERLWTTLCTEAAYLVWKLRCERVIQNEGACFSEREVQNRWTATMNGRLTLDRRTAVPWLGGTKVSAKGIELMWLPVIRSPKDLPQDWVRNSEVLVGIRGPNG